MANVLQNTASNSALQGASSLLVMLVEDEPAFVTLLQEWLQDTQKYTNTSKSLASIQLHHVATLQDAIAALPLHPFVAVVVDLNLPDSQGVDTYITLQNCIPQLPIVVLSGLQDEELAMQTMRLGAQDYLIKSQISGPLLLRAVRYSIERFSLRQELFRVHETERRQQERQFLDRIVNRSSVSSVLLGVPAIKQSLPELFQKFSDRFASVLDQAMEQRTHKIDCDFSSILAEMARELSFLKCGPRDIVEIYLDALSRLSGRFNPVREQAYSEEGRLLALQLMGLLVSQYRPYALRIGKPLDRDSLQEENL
ncbi:MAG: response regulator [Magnetococcales bacterium]|nr:response regulator [Magnetococcales bacterium]MBF0115342.1 response regulator [Magnetococcales bacterium]